MRAQADRLPSVLRERLFAGERPFEIRSVQGTDDPVLPSALPPERAVWFRTVERLPDDPAIHRALLAYASDYAFLGTALFPHQVTWLSPGMQVASLDHVLWFHAPSLRVDEWLLHVIDSPRAVGARGARARPRVLRRRPPRRVDRARGIDAPAGAAGRLV